jgi:hypothetical protein
MQRPRNFAWKPCAASRKKKHRRASKRAAAGISNTNARKFVREIEMTKFVTFAAALAVFAPVAAIMLMQAAQIVA